MLSLFPVAKPVNGAESGDGKNLNDERCGNTVEADGEASARYRPRQVEPVRATRDRKRGAREPTQRCHYHERGEDAFASRPSTVRPQSRYAARRG